MITGRLQPKKTKKGTEYYYMIIQTDNPDGTKGKPQWESTGLPVKNNKRKAQAILDARLNELNSGQTNLPNSTESVQPAPESDQSNSETPADSTLFSDWVREWLNNKDGTVRDSTIEGYRLHAKHVIDYFDSKETLLSQITYQDIDTYCTLMLKEGKVNRQTGAKSGLAVRTVRSHKFVINAALNKAVLYGLIKQNPAEQIKVTSKNNRALAKKPVFFTLKEAQDYVAFLKENNDVLHDLIWATLKLGLRKSEALGLTEQAIDFKRKKIYINRTVVKIIKIHDENDTKTADSDREYPLTPELETFCRTVINKKRENMRFYGNKYIHTDFLFTWDDGRPFSPDFVYHHHKRMVAKFGRPELTVHNLRHSAASILFEMGWSAKDIQEWLGHADYYTTMNIYTHIAKTHREEKALELDGILEQASAKSRTEPKNVHKMILRMPNTKVM